MAKVTAEQIVQAFKVFADTDVMDERQPHEIFCDALNEIAGTDIVPENFEPHVPLGVMFEVMFGFEGAPGGLNDSAEESNRWHWAIHQVAIMMASDLEELS